MRVTEQAEEDIDKQKDYDRKKLAEKIKEKLVNDREKDKISYIEKSQFGIEFHRLKLTEENFNHRIYFDYVNSETVVFAVRHRDYAYTNQDLKEVEKRLKSINAD